MEEGVAGMKMQCGSWERLVARQPILDSHQNVFAYELLFRSSLENFFQSGPLDDASSNVLVSSLLFGIQSLTGGRRAFVNFTRNLLTQEYATFLAPEKSVIEILEDVEPDSAVVDACKFLKQKGYLIALDDFPLDGRLAPLVPFADIVKVDWLHTPLNVCKHWADELIPRKIQMLAEKVETHEQFHQALGMGYRYFQGFFFCEPEILAGRDIPALQSNCLMLLREVHGQQPDMAAIEQTLMREPSLCYKLLRYLNSAAFCFHDSITSVRHALSLLGLREVQKWVSLVTLTSMRDDKPDALVAASMIRAKFCESIGQTGNQSRHATELFLMGLFSLIDAILDQPMEKLMRDLPLSSEISTALLGKESPYQPIYNLICAYERSDWKQVSRLADRLCVSEENITEAYIEAVAWSHEIIRADKIQSRA